MQRRRRHRCSSPCSAQSGASQPLPRVEGGEEGGIERRRSRTPLHYDSYIAIFIISESARYPRSRGRV